MGLGTIPIISPNYTYKYFKYLFFYSYNIKIIFTGTAKRNKFLSSTLLINLIQLNLLFILEILYLIVELSYILTRFKNQRFY